MQERVQRWASILVGAGVIGLIGWMTVEQTVNPKPRTTKIDADPDASAAAAADAGPMIAEPDLDASTLLSDLLVPEGGAFLPSGAPRQVRIGVVLVQWRGAEGAATSTRSKQDALTTAQRLAADAKGDFRRAVSSGDPGSSEDVGRIPRGVLDPRTEAAVFSLASKEVSDVLETPRGYWIVKRID
jgi:hypothetical protein